MDQLYFLDGYYEGKYFVYTADALAGFTPYIDSGYLDQDFFEDKSSAFSVVCEGTRLRIISADAVLSCSFAQTTTANKDARTTVTLSTIANVAAQNDKIRFYSAEINSTSTQTSQSSFIAGAAIALTSAFAPIITANASVSNGSNFTTNFALTALTGVIRQFPLNQLTGLGATSSQSGVIQFNQSLYPPSTLGSIDVRDRYWTFSVWVKRDSISGNYQAIAEGTLNTDGGITLKDNDVRIRFNYDPDEPGATWTDVAPTDTEWHHYLFRSRVNTANETYPADTWDLWIDGLYKNTAFYQASGDITFGGRFGSLANSQLLGAMSLGYGLIRNDVGGYDFVGAPLLGGVAQVWMGYTTDSQFKVEKFYSGLVDMGALGTSTGLPTPVYYNKLTAPYTGVTWSSESPVPSPASTALGLPSVQAQFTLGAVPENVLVVTANLASTATMSATAFKIVTSTSNLNATATTSTTVAKITGVVSALDLVATLAAVNQRVRFVSSSLNSEFSTTATSTKVQPAAASISANCSVSATIDDRTRSQSAALSSQFNLAATIDDRTRDAIALEVGQFTLNLVYTVIKAPGAILTSQFTQSSDVQKVVVTTGNFTARFTIASTVFRVLIGEAYLQVNGFQLTQGDILNFDPCREIGVEQETRWAKILPESRLIRVEQETRTLKVPQETRVLRVDYETRVNILQC